MRGEARARARRAARGRARSSSSTTSARGRLGALVVVGDVGGVAGRERVAAHVRDVGANLMSSAFNRRS